MRAIRHLPLLGALLFAACSVAAGDDDPTRVDGDRAAQLVAEEHAILLDVRTPQEFAAGHVEGAINVPVQTLPEAASELAIDRPVVVYCRSGHRSARAAALLEREGYEAHDLGPMSAWTGGS
ncbi:MAG TPA: rhodanese-like domain-containing protein [Sandaracinaceae bacterium LLY-WYZ-13_1]|nr:rhodanese-like domain-containing protein [Sandaracinaceae bacterium LLY-WYZ-13_1]